MTIKLKMPRRKVNEKMTPEALHRAAETYREMYDKVVAHNILLQKQLAIAVEALENAHTHPSSMSLKDWCEQALQQIKELDK